MKSQNRQGASGVGARRMAALVMAAMMVLVSLLSLPHFSASAETMPSNAQVISSGETVSGSLRRTSAAVYYRINVPADGTVTIVTQADDNSSLSVRRYTSNGTAYKSPIPMNMTVTSPLSKGTYYLKINPPSTTTAQTYSVKVTYNAPRFGQDTEPNNSIAQALTLAEKTWMGGVAGAQGNQNGDEDYYAIDVTADNTLVKFYGYYNGNHNFPIFDLLQSSGATLVSSMNIFKNYTGNVLNKGRYYLRVHGGYSEYYISYTTGGAAAPAVPPEFNFPQEPIETTSIPANTTPPPVAADYTTAIVLSSMKLYASASTTATTVATLAAGDRLTIKRDVNAAWYEVVNGQNQTGYVSKVAVMGETYLGNKQGQVINQTVTLRLLPYASAASVVTAPVGSKLVLLNMSSNGWYRVAYSGKTGYMLKDDIQRLS